MSNLNRSVLAVLEYAGVGEIRTFQTRLVLRLTSRLRSTIACTTKDSISSAISKTMGLLYPGSDVPPCSKNRTCRYVSRETNKNSRLSGSEVLSARVSVLLSRRKWGGKHNQRLAVRSCSLLRQVSATASFFAFCQGKVSHISSTGWSCALGSFL